MGSDISFRTIHECKYKLVVPPPTRRTVTDGRDGQCRRYFCIVLKLLLPKSIGIDLFCFPVSTLQNSIGDTFNSAAQGNVKKTVNALFISSYIFSIVVGVLLYGDFEKHKIINIFFVHAANCTT